MRKLVSFNVHNRNPVVHATQKGEGRFLVFIWSKDELGNEVQIELENIQKMPLMLFNDMIMEQFTEAITELTPITDGGFVIYHLN